MLVVQTYSAENQYHSQTWFKIYRDDKGKYEYAGNNCGLINPFHSSTFIVIVIIIIITILIITIAMKDISWISLQVRTSLIWLCESVTRPEYQNSCTYKLTERGNVKMYLAKKNCKKCIEIIKDHLFYTLEHIRAKSLRNSQHCWLSRLAQRKSYWDHSQKMQKKCVH